jgi:hypothetical protein
MINGNFDLSKFCSSYISHFSENVTFWGPRLLFSEWEWCQFELLKKIIYFFQRNRKFFLLIYSVCTWVSSASIYNFQGKLSPCNLINFVIYYFFYLIFFIYFPLQGLSWDEKYKKSWPFSYYNRTNNKREIPQILGWNTDGDHYRNLPPSIVQEGV